MKKLTSLLLAALLALSSSATVFAESIPVQSEEYPFPALPSEELSVSVDEYADSIPVESEELPPLAITPDEPTEFAHVCDGSCVEDFIEIELTDEEFEQLDAVAAEQQALIASTQSNTGKASILDQYDFSTDYYYNQLSAGEKKIYDGIIKLFEDVLDSTADLTDNNTDIDTSYLGSVTIDISITKDRLYDILRAAYYANPRLYHFSTTRSTASDLSRIGVFIKDEYLTYAARVDTEKKLAAATTEYMTAVNKCSTDYQKAKLIAEMLCDNIVYDLEARFDQTVHGALIDKLCVCNGFAMAYTYLCNAAGIDCVGYRNLPHAWNKVKIGGSWYETDVTWMNNDTYGFYNYKYLMNSYEGVRSGNDSHEIDEYSTPSLTLPSCPTPYDHGFDTGTAKNVKVESVNGYLRVTWDEVKGASGYRVSRNDGVASTVLGQNYFIDNSDDLVVGTKYTYCVNPYVYGWNGYSSWASWVTHVEAVPAQNVNATYSSGKVNVKWDAVPYATEYYVWRAAYGGKFENIGTVKTNAYTDTTFIGGNKYRYCISARADGVFVTYGYMNGYVQTEASKPTNIKATAGDGKVTLTWDAVTGATKYAVSIYKGTGTNYNTLTTSITGTSYTATGLTNGTTYQFLVQAYVGGKWSTFTTADHVSATPNDTKPADIKATTASGKVTLNWNAVENATKYAVSIYKGTGTNYTILSKTITGTSYTATGLTNGTTYQFLVQAYIGGKWSTFTTADHIKATPTA